jgi:hypothetical protein
MIVAVRPHPPLADKNVGLFVGLLKTAFFLIKQYQLDKSFMRFRPGAPPTLSNDINDLVEIYSPGMSGA